MAASKVNVKFVIGLAAGLTALFGLVAYLGFQALTKSGDEYAEMGDRLVQEANYNEAAKAYAMAVAHERTRVDWLVKWRDTILKTTPPTEIEYREAFRTYYAILEALATLQETDQEHVRNYLDALFQQYRTFGSSVQSWQSFVDRTTERLDRLERAGAPQEFIDSIKRYRGLGTLRLIEALPDRGDLSEQARKDLEAAVAAHPDDVEAGLGLVRLHMTQWLKLRREGRTDRAEEAYRRILALIDELHKQNPENAEVVLNAIAVKVDRAMQSAEKPAERIEALKQLGGAEQELISAVRDADASKIPSSFLPRVAQLLTLLQPESVNKTMAELVGRLLESRPNDPFLLRLHASALGELGRHDEAIAILERIAQMPDLPVGIDGMILKGLRHDAIFQQGMFWLAARDAATDQASKEAALANAKERRALLVQRVEGGEESRLTLLLDANIALAEGRSEIAVERLQRLDMQTKDDDPVKPRVLDLLAQALRRQGQLGAAADRYSKLVGLQPFNVEAILALIQIDLSLQDADDAQRHLDMLKKLAPESDQIRAMEQMIAVLRGKTSEVTDPVMLAIVRAEEAANKIPADYAAARAEIESLLPEHDNDVRVHVALAQIAYSANNADEAKRILDAASQRFPRNQTVESMRRRLELAQSDDRVGDMMRMIDETNAQPFEKAVQKARLMREAGRAQEAEQFLAEAVALAPDHPVVVEHQFLAALEKRDEAKAKELADRAVRLNADQANGLTFEARLRMMRGDLDGALESLRRASERLPYNATVWRLRGQVELNKGQVDAAIGSLSKAYEYQPQDLETALIYAMSLTQLQRESEALTVVRAARRLHKASPLLNEAWLSLEESAGDLAVAIEERRRIHSRTPGDVRNSFGLGRMLLQGKHWAEARTLIDEIKASGAAEPLDVAVLEARWHALQTDAGVDTGRQIIVDAMGKLPADKQAMAGPYLVLAQYLIDFGRREEAMAAFEQAATRQNPEVMEADRSLAEFLFNSGVRAYIEKSLEPYKRLIDAGIVPEGDPHLFRLRRVEALSRLERWKEAEAELAQVPGVRESKDVRILLLGADVARGVGDMRRAREMLNKAVAEAPNDPRPFMQRAMLSANDPELFQDALRDLEQAVRLQPGLVVARKLRVELFRRAGRDADVIAELRAAVEANPESDELRVLMITELMVSGRREEARAAAAQVARDRPRSAFWQVHAGDVYSDSAEHARRVGDMTRLAEHYNQAAAYYAKAAEAQPNPTTSYRLANALLSTSPAKPNEALEALRKLGPIVDEDALLLVMKSRALQLAGRAQEAEAGLAKSLSLLSSYDEMREWFTQAQRLAGGTSDVASVLARLNPPAALRAGYLVALTRLEIPQTSRHSELLARLADLAGQTDDPGVLSELYNVRGTLQYALRMYREAAESFAKGIEVDPTNLDFNNNLAFTRAKHLNDPQGALKPAERAVELAPTNPIALDTLGWVYLELGRNSQAEATLSRALQIARPAYQGAPNDGARFQAAVQLLPVLIHSGQLQAAKPDWNAARRLAEEASDLLGKFPQLEGEYKADLDELLERIKRAE